MSVDPLDPTIHDGHHSLLVKENLRLKAMATLSDPDPLDPSFNDNDVRLLVKNNLRLKAIGGGGSGAIAAASVDLIPDINAWGNVQAALSDLFTTSLTTDTAQSVTGAKTFDAPLVLTNAPALGTHAANKTYVDGRVVSMFGPWVACVLQSGVSGSLLARWVIYNSGMVQLKGTVFSPTWDTSRKIIATLPPGLAPASTMYFPVVSGAGAQENLSILLIQSNGAMSL